MEHEVWGSGPTVIGRWRARHVMLPWILATAMLTTGCLRPTENHELTELDRALGVHVENLCNSPELAGFTDIPADSPEFSFAAKLQTVTGPGPRQHFDRRESVKARSPEGGYYVAYCGSNPNENVVAHTNFVSNLANRRHRFGGTAYYPHDIFIGRQNKAGQIDPCLFFRDVGFENTAPHGIGIDSSNRCHLMVADIDIFQDNRLMLYWVVGDPSTGKWLSASLIDRHGFTSWAHPWTGAWKDQVHLSWNWCDITRGDILQESGIYHVLCHSGRLGSKIRVAKGVVSNWDAAVQPSSGRLVYVFSQNLGVYLVSCTAQGTWTRKALLTSSLIENVPVSICPGERDTYLVRVGSEEPKEWEISLTEPPKR